MDSRVPLGLEAIGSTNMAPFLTKLFQIVSSPSTQQTICWTAKGDSFVISDPDTFAREILPTYFKHNNIRSFIRQLNTYGFRKRTNISSTDEHLEFFHEKFRRDEPALTQIKRCHQSKAAAARAAGGGDMDTVKLGAGRPRHDPRARRRAQEPAGPLQTEIRDYNHQMEQKVNLLAHPPTSGGRRRGAAARPPRPASSRRRRRRGRAPPARRARPRRSRRCRRRPAAGGAAMAGDFSAAATRCSGPAAAPGWRRPRRRPRRDRRAGGRDRRRRRRLGAGPMGGLSGFGGLTNLSNPAGAKGAADGASGPGLQHSSRRRSAGAATAAPAPARREALRGGAARRGLPPRCSAASLEVAGQRLLLLFTPLT